MNAAQRRDQLRPLGVDHVMVSPSSPWTEGSIAALASLLPEARELTA